MEQKKNKKKNKKNRPPPISVLRSSVRLHATHAIGELKNPNMENNNWKFKVSRKYHNSGKFLHSESQICMLLHKYHISERKEKQIWRTRFENWNKYVPQFWAISAFRFANTVFPHIVSAETILFWLWAYVLWPLITVHKCAETIQGRKLLKGGNYMRKYGIWWFLKHMLH